MKLDSIGSPGHLYPAVTIAFAKRRGTNAVAVAEGLIAKVEALKGVAIPSDVEVLVTRNYGETANEKVNELVRELLIAIGIIVVLLAFFARSARGVYRRDRGSDHAGDHAAGKFAGRLHHQPGHAFRSDPVAGSAGR